jgi:prenylcysteine oxidase/farnesylcysteine lyase
VGGRATTVNVYDDKDEPVEVGATVFIPGNEILFNATKELNIETEEYGLVPDNDTSDTMGVFNGTNIVFSLPQNNWAILAKLFHRYRVLDPMRTTNLAQATIDRLRLMYKKPIFPFLSLFNAADEAGLYPSMSITAQQFLGSNGIDSKGAYAREIVQGTARTVYSQNLGRITGLQAMVSLSTQGAIGIKGGNWRLFQAMIDASDTDLRLNTSVTSVSKSANGKWVVKFNKKGDQITDVEIYDSVIIAGPLQCSQVTIEPKLPKESIVKDYATVHVTLFTSPKKLDPTYFGMRPNNLVPGSILTTLSHEESENWRMMMSTGKEGVGSSGFYYIISLRETLRRYSGGLRTEYLYKMFSPGYFGDDKIKAMLGVHGNVKMKGNHYSGDDNSITWIYRHTWDAAYPQEGPKLVFDDIKIDDGLWYTAGIETLVSTMETSSLMGMNIAKLIVEEWDADEQRIEKIEEPKPKLQTIETEEVVVELKH